MLLEMHCHTSRYSKCSQISPADLLSQVKKKELQGVIITEHHYLWREDDIKALRLEVELDKNFLIMAGHEVETDFGHVLIKVGKGQSPEMEVLISRCFKEDI